MVAKYWCIVPLGKWLIQILASWICSSKTTTVKSLLTITTWTTGLIDIATVVGGTLLTWTTRVRWSLIRFVKNIRSTASFIWKSGMNRWVKLNNTKGQKGYLVPIHDMQEDMVSEFWTVNWNWYIYFKQLLQWW